MVGCTSGIAQVCVEGVNVPAIGSPVNGGLGLRVSAEMAQMAVPCLTELHVTNAAELIADFGSAS